MRVEELLSRLMKVRRGPSGWQGCCPAHDDRKQSLSVSVGQEGRILLKCFAGCTAEQICQSLGIRLADLFAEDYRTHGSPHPHRGDGGRSDPAWKGHPPARPAVVIPPPEPSARKQVAVYPYRDEEGRVLYEVVRYEPKDFRQRVPLEGGGYQWRLDGVRRVPYRLPELLAADPLWEVFIVEGEKDADLLASVGCTTTTNVGGAGQWRPEYAQWLKDRSVVIIPDNDEPGKRHAEQVARSLVGVAGRISILELPGLEPKGDVSDFMQGDPDARMTELVKHMLAAPDWKPTEETPPVLTSPPSPAEVPQPQMITVLAAPTALPPASRLAPRFLAVPLSEIPREEIHWLWQDRFPMGMLSLVAGFPEAGKSFLLMDMAARISRGLPWPDQPDVVQPIGRTLYLSFEDSPGQTVRPRTENCGGDTTQVMIFRGMDFGDCQAREFDIRLHLPPMEQYIVEHPDIRLIVIDPVTSALGDGDQNSNAEMRRAMTQLNDFAQRTGRAVVGLTHFSKRMDGPAMYRLLGSVAFTAVARSVWCVVEDPESENPDNPTRLLLCEKNSNSPMRTGLSYRIENGAVRWLSGAVRLTASRFLNQSDQAQPGKRRQAEQFLLDALESGAEQSADDLEKLATEKGIAVTTLRRAKRTSNSGNHRWPKGSKRRMVLVSTQAIRQAPAL